VSARVNWAKGGEAHIVSITANAIVLRSTVSAPPGSRIEGTVAAQDGAGSAMALRVKVHVSRREGQGQEEFVLQGRALDLTREVRVRLEAMVREGEG
jgi:hypothetical protein